MATNQTPRSYDPLVLHLEEAADGADALGVALGLKQNTAAAIRADLVALTGSPGSPGLKDLWNAAKTAKTAATAAAQQARTKGKAIASASVGVLKPRLGSQWNSSWQTAGFTSGSLAIPENPLTLLQQLRAYFTANPTHEKSDLGPGISATAAACEAAAQAISAAATASNNSNTAAGVAKKNFDDGIETGRARLSGLREELARLISDEDERWYSFGFERPADPETPEIPENLVVAAGANGLYFADWDDSRRAETYRAAVRNAAGDTVAERIVSESETTLSGLPSGTLTLTVTARNPSGGESQPGNAVVITVP